MKANVEKISKNRNPFKKKEFRKDGKKQWKESRRAKESRWK